MTKDQATVSLESTLPVVRSIPRFESPREGITSVNGQEMYCIPAFDTMSPFLMSIVSDSDLWMYVSSTGGLTAGRRSPDNSLFPYETDDRLHHLHGITGPLTLIREGDSSETWEPFRGPVDSTAIVRNLYKSVAGNAVLFEETHRGLGLTFSYAWQNCNDFGFVRTATLVNHSPHRPRSIELLDGLLNVMPAGVQLGVQQGSSCLADAYKVCEVDRGTKLGIYSMSSLITDRAEPAESLRANVVWSRGLAGYRVALSGRQIDRFRLGQGIAAECRMRGERGNFMVAAQVELKPGQAMTWDIVADVGRTQRQVGELLRFLQTEPRPNAVVRDHVEASRRNLVQIVAGSDGLQSSADKTMVVHHFANVLFNTMRGGSFANGGRVSRCDFARSVRARNKVAAERHADLLSRLPEQMSPGELIASLRQTGDQSLIRIGYEYLPITFGRRHGDPSRPWNLFKIHLRDDDGSPVLAYQGNWRDIFQNWEALCLSYPDYLDHVIAKFVNASTLDGFNPYRVTHEGIEWEEPEPHNPWANIGYWGDHQIVYLSRLLDLSQRHHPGRLARLLAEPLFSYADVPYRLKRYASLVEDCRRTIDFDLDRSRAIAHRTSSVGSDAKLVSHADGSVVHVTLAEKLLVPVLSKLSNLVVGGGIWMNTQRPEWNDANNALAGFGLSVVTLCYLRRHVLRLIDLLESAGLANFAISGGVAAWMSDVFDALQSHVSLLDGEQIAPVDRKRVLDALGEAFCSYRAKAYRDGPGRPQDVPAEQLLGLLRLAERFSSHSIHANRREDGLYHSYNLLKLSRDGREAHIERLPRMLEGQVAVLSSGLLSADEAQSVIDALYGSDLYRSDQDSFVLYPDRPAREFLQKNVIAAADAGRIPLIREMLAADDRRIVIAEPDGGARFNADLNNEAALVSRLEQIAREPRWAKLVSADDLAVRELYEDVFQHHSFTGRSGSMFGYEGLGCIYWHMVAKLLVAVQETAAEAKASAVGAGTINRLTDSYYRIRQGLGFNKTARHYGAFPTDPYSHTPGHSGARQPGMTGQVKEEMITRLGELGVRVIAGAIRFQPELLNRSEFTTEVAKFEYFSARGELCSLSLPPGSLAFTYCQVPVVYRIDPAGPRVVLIRADREPQIIEANQIDAATSASILSRSGDIVRIEVAVADSMLRCNRQVLPGLQSLPPESAAGAAATAVRRG